INPFVIDPCSFEEKLRRHSLRDWSHVEEFRTDAVRYEPDTVGRQIVAELKKNQRLPVGHDPLVGSCERPFVRPHVIRMLPNTILPPKIICATLLRFPAHRVIATFFQTVHGHDVWRTRLRATPPSLRAVPKAEGGMNVDNVELVSRFLNVSRNSLRKFHGPKTVRPPLFWEQVFEEHWLHAMPQLPQFLDRLRCRGCGTGKNTRLALTYQSLAASHRRAP